MTGYVIFAILLLVLLCIPFIFNHGNLNKIKAKKTGDGQYGSADWANEKEIKENFKIVDFQPELWRKGKNLPSIQGIILGAEKHGNKIKAIIDDSDSNTMFVAAPGGGKTTSILYPNLEYAGAVGMPCFVTDTKGNAFKIYGSILSKYYNFNTYVIDLRFPLKSNSFNFLNLVNKYMDRYLSSDSISDKAKTEAYAKNIANTIIHMDGFKSAGQNQYFYDSAESVISGITLLVSELCEKKQRHIVSVFKLIRQLLEVDPATVGIKGINPTLYLTELYSLLPENHIVKDLLAPTATTEFKQMASVMSTAMSKMLRFIDSEIEQIICFDDGFNIDDFIQGKSVVFFVVDEKSTTKNFMLNLILRQMYNELLGAAEFCENISLPMRVYMHLDEFGTYSAIDNVQQIFSAVRSRNILNCPYLQGLSQLNQNYGKDVAEIIKSTCQNVMFSFVSPLSHDARDFSEMLGTQTVQSGSVSRKNNYSNISSQTSINMIKRPLLAPDEITNIKKGNWILKKTGMNPVKINLPKGDSWGIQFDVPPFEIEKKSVQHVEYADRNSLMQAVRSKYSTSYTYNISASAPAERQTISEEYIN